MPIPKHWQDKWEHERLTIAMKLAGLEGSHNELDFFSCYTGTQQNGYLKEADAIINIVLNRLKRDLNTMTNEMTKAWLNGLDVPPPSQSGNTSSGGGS